MTEEATAEERAKTQGWTPKEEFKGDPAKWRSAEEFLKVGENISAVQSERNNKLTDDIAEMKQTMRDFQNQQFKVIAEAQQRGYNKAMAKIEKKQLAAVEDGDVDGFKALEKEKKALEKPKEAPVQPKIDPVFVEWHKDNQWYKSGSPDEVSMAADTYGQVLLQRRPDLRGAEYYKEVEKHIKRVFPDKFKTADPGKIDSSSHKSAKTGKKTFDQLPSEAQKACNMQVKKFGITQDEYVKQYFAAYGE